MREQPRIVLTTGTVRLTFSAPQRPGNDPVVDYLVDVSGEGVDVRASVTSIGGDALPDYFAGLAERFRGWSGAREWCSLEGQLRIDARWHNRGRVTLDVRLRPKAYDSPWDLAVVFEVEAGAEMDALSAAAANFFDAAGYPGR